MIGDNEIITVVIPVYNREQRVGATLECLSRQSADGFRVILVDNNSTDSTLPALRRWASSQPFAVEILCEERRGAASARQTGLENVSTEWTLFFDSDDEMAPGHIERVIRGIREHPEASLIGWDIYNSRRGRHFRAPFVTADAQFRSLFNATMSTQRYCATTELFRRAGGWRRDLGVWDDIELAARLLALGPAMAKLDGTPTVTVNLSDDSITHGENAQNILMIERALAYIAETLGPRRARWTDLKLAVLAARQPKAEGDRLMARLMSRTRSGTTLLRLAYTYTRLGGRGIARILRPVL